MKGATLTSLTPPLCVDYFNPRSHEGSDPGGRVSKLGMNISIHAPMKGATGSTAG